ncbi:MAG: HAD family phosphatase [Deltaproteobacteria bacterium]|nr:HAD family phosphatase [Deltaproteobacteria bacterium]
MIHLKDERKGAILFDFDGVLVDNEPIHLKMFQKVLSEEGVRLTRKDYYTKYLGMDDRGCLTTAFKDYRRPASPSLVKDLIRRKSRYYQSYIRRHLKFLPGVKTFIKKANEKHYLAIVSGALRGEILLILRLGGLKKFFPIIVSAEDVRHGKPNPEGYRLGLKKLCRRYRTTLRPADCLVIEDSIWGIEAAHRAGMKCLAVTSSYPAKKLKKADRVVSRLKWDQWPA